jgi:hypothetical protein
MKLDALRQCGEVVLLDSNALIFHAEDATDHALLSDRDAPLEARRATHRRYAEAMLVFYEGWRATIAESPTRLYVTDAVLDLELSGHRFIQRNPKRYRPRIGPVVPCGDLVRDHETRAVKKAKNALLTLLDRRGRLGPLLKKRARGLKGRLEAHLLARPLWQSGAQTEGLSWVDRNLALNALAATRLGQSALVTNDRALRRYLTSLGYYLKNPEWARGGPAEADALKLTELRLELITWTREAHELRFEAA